MTTQPADDTTTDRVLEWTAGEWLNPPPALRTDEEDGALLVTAAEGSDFWRTTSYGFVRDTGHALLVPFAPGSAVEVTFRADLPELYDQAGVLVRAAPTTWLKAGVERSDGVPHLGAVVTHGTSDWSLAPVPEWAGQDVTIRVSRTGDALTVRARTPGSGWRMVRLAHLAPDAEATAGPFCCAPERAGLTVRFTRFATGPADRGLHEGV
jgi:regulation of enolase protein 1 (concanavalin A-like superfamily)